MPQTLQEGSQGPDVSSWQAMLSSAGYAVAASGVFDAPTAAATKAWQAAKGLKVDAVVGTASWLAMTGKPSVAADPHAEFGRGVLLNVWRDVTGEDPNLSELQIAGAQAQLESNYGLSSYTNKDTGETSAHAGPGGGPINNWGAVQAHGDQPGFMTTDSHADGTTYNALYRIYPTPEEGAADMLRQMTVRRPSSWALMKVGDIDAWATQMRTKDPQTKVLGYFEQAADERAKGIERRVQSIAQTLGEPVAAQRGGPMPDGGTPYPPPDGTADGGDSSNAAGWTLGAVLAAALAGAAYYFRKQWWPL